KLGSQDLAGKTIGIAPGLGGVPLDDGVEANLRASAERLAETTGMRLVDIDVNPPNLAALWMIGNLSTLLAELGDRWPKCADDLTDEIAIGLRLSESLYNLHTAAAAEKVRVEANDAMAHAFEAADFIVAATNPGPAFPADSPMSSANGGFIDWAKSNAVAKVGFRGAMGALRVVGGAFPRLPTRLVDEVTERFPEVVAMGGLTIISNIYGNPAVSIPSGQIGGLPVGMQVLAPHHHDRELFDIALAAEREMPWPKVAPAVTLASTAG
ncbi:MAG: hypothetical protein AAGK32_14500, partial [Actinomycetota bacterium]